MPTPFDNAGKAALLYLVAAVLVAFIVGISFGVWL